MREAGLRRGVRDTMKTSNIKTSSSSSPNKLCGSCRRTCKQAANAVVANCPRYYPFKRTSSKTTKEFTWKQLDLGL